MYFSPKSRYRRGTRKGQDHYGSSLFLPSTLSSEARMGELTSQFQGGALRWRPQLRKTLQLGLEKPRFLSEKERLHCEKLQHMKKTRDREQLFQKRDCPTPSHSTCFARQNLSEQLSCNCNNKAARGLQDVQHVIHLLSGFASSRRKSLALTPHWACQSHC